MVTVDENGKIYILDTFGQAYERVGSSFKYIGGKGA